MKFTLPKLPYAYDALEPYVDSRTMELHHAKHHQTYVNKLNEALEKYPSVAKAMEGKSELEALEILLCDLSSVPEEIRGAVRNHGGGHLNHTMFWNWMMPASGKSQIARFAKATARRASGELLDAINFSFGDFTKFREEFTKAAAGTFGSGWAWLVLSERSESNGLVIITTPNQDSPLSQGLKPILGLDVWEHAYYLKYQNKRPEYIEAWWNVVNWEQVESEYTRHGAHSI